MILVLKVSFSLNQPSPPFTPLTRPILIAWLLRGGVCVCNKNASEINLQTTTPTTRGYDRYQIVQGTSFRWGWSSGGLQCSQLTDLLQEFLSLLSPTQQVNQDLSRQLLQDGYHLDEIPDDEDLDLIPPKPVASSPCPCCFGESLSCTIQ